MPETTGMLTTKTTKSDWRRLVRTRRARLTARLKLKPGQKGTMKLLAQHGDALVCVRYRDDEASRTRTKTVELVVERTAWNPPAKKYDDNDLVPVRIGYAEKDLIAAAKAAKGRWNPDAKLWFIRYGNIKGADDCFACSKLQTNKSTKQEPYDE